MIVKTQSIILIHVLFVNSFPIILGLLVANVKGIILKGNARLKNTCVKINRSSILEVLEPYNHKHMNTGITAINLVTNLLAVTLLYM